MTYVLCDVDDCINHDGEGCTLECVEVSRWFYLDNRPSCNDYEKCEEDE